MENSDDARVQEAVLHARKVAAEFDRVFLLHCPDPETQRIVLPEQPDHGLQTRLDTAIATELVANGVEVVVQVVDRAAYLSWLGGRDSTRAWRTGYRDPARLVRGVAALDLLGVPASAVRPRAKPPALRERKGTPADRLVRAWLDNDPGLDRILGPLLEDGRQGILDMAIRKVAETYVDEEAEDFMMMLLEEAEAAEAETGSWAALFVVAALVNPDLAKMPDPAPIAAGMKASGHFSIGCDIAILPAWFDPDAITSMPACALRRILRDLAGGRMPAGLQPLAGPPPHGTVVLLGVTADPYPMPWEEAAGEEENADHTPPVEDLDPVESMRDAAFDAWCDVLLASNPDIIDIRLPTIPSQLAFDLEDAAGDAGEDEDAATGSSAEEVRDFVEIAAREAGEEALVCVPRIVNGRVEVSLYTASGRLLDARDFGAPEQGAVPDALLAAIAAILPVAEQPPGRR